MKSPLKIITLIVAVLLFVPFGVGTAADHDHTHGKEKAPHDGRLIEIEKMHVEFLIDADKTAKVYLYDDQLKPVTPGEQKISLIVQGKDNAKNKIELNKKDDAFASSSPIAIPEGAKAILTVKVGDKINNLRFDLNMAMCGECKKIEYACACAH